MKLSVVFVALLALCVPVTLFAHGFGQRIDLPVPLSLYLFGAGAIVAFSFILLGVLSGKVANIFTSYSTIALSNRKWFRVIFSSPLIEVMKFLLVMVLLVTVMSGFMGNQNPAFNSLPTIVWIIFAIGVTFFSAFIGDVWKVINPFRTLFNYLEVFLSVFNLIPKARTWPVWLGVWPAVCLFFSFRWIENVSSFSSEPQMLAFAISIYAGVTFVGMMFFGRDTWLQKADPFSVFFSILAHFSITELRTVEGKAELYLRPPMVGVLKQSPTISEVAFILLMLSSVAADGVLSTPVFQNVFIALLEINIPWETVGTLGLIGLYILFVCVYVALCFLMKRITADRGSVSNFAKMFVYSFLPIAIVYEVAHFVSILVIEGQRVIYLISDPLGVGWDIFGTASYEMNYTLINLKMLWNFQVGLIIIGHIVAILIAHTVAERYFSNAKKTLVSQYPMLILMIFYSVLSLWIMAQPIVAIE